MKPFLTDEDKQLRNRYLAMLEDDIAKNPASMKYPHTSGSAPINPVNVQGVKDRAVMLLIDRSLRKLYDLYPLFQFNKKIGILVNDPKASALVKEQELEIKKQVENIYKDIWFSHSIINSKIGFIPVEKEIYHLYYNCKDEKILSLIEPEKNPGFEKYICSVRYTVDKTFDITNISKDFNNLIKQDDSFNININKIYKSLEKEVLSYEKSSNF